MQSTIAQSYFSRPKNLLINGRHEPSASGKTFPVFDPSTGKILASVAEAEREDVDRAVRAARGAFDAGPWSRMGAHERGRLIWRLADAIRQHGEELAQIEAVDTGKPINFARHVDIPSAALEFEYFAGWSNKIEGRTKAISPFGADVGFLAFTQREPVGVVGLIVPFNFPLVLAAWKLAPALAAGCTAVLKPDERTPFSALRLSELALEVGFPEGVFNVVCGPGPSTGRALAEHPMVNKVSFTGSVEAARSILGAASGNLKKVSLELGGKSPNVIFEDADLEAAIAGASLAAFANQGEFCVAGSRLYVQHGALARVLEGLAAQAQKMRVGPSLDESSEMGPLITREHLDRVAGYVESGLSQGAKIVTGGRRLERDGYFLEPTVMANVSQDMTVVQEEIFGPVVTVQSFSDEAELVKLANDTPYGLAAGVWTRDIGKAHRVARQISAGTIWINCYHVFDPSMPRGGYKLSGWGREGGFEAIELFTETKSIISNLG